MKRNFRMVSTEVSMKINKLQRKRLQLSLGSSIANIDEFYNCRKLFCGISKN